MLEEGSFRGRTADFVFMFLFGGVLMIVSFPGSGPQAWHCCAQPVLVLGRDVGRDGGLLWLRMSGHGVLSPRWQS